MSSWQNPWKWSEFRSMRRSMAIASAAMITAIVLFVPCAWIVLVPSDPTLRPDLTESWAWVGLGLCFLLGTAGHNVAGRTRARFDQAIYGITQALREKGGLLGFPLETDLGEVFPPVLISRQHRMIGFAGVSPMIVRMDQVSVDVSAGDDGSIPGTPRQPHLLLRLKDCDPDRVFIISGRGLGRANLEQTVVLGERLKDFLTPSIGWDEKTEKRVDVEAFVDSMRPRRA